MKKLNQGHAKGWNVRLDSFGLIVSDFLMIHLAYFLALWVRFDCTFSLIPRGFLGAYATLITGMAIVSIILFRLLRMYQSLWRYASYIELIRTIVGSSVSSLLHSALITVLITKMPVSYHMLGGFFQVTLLLIPRFSFRAIRMVSSVRHKAEAGVGRVMIIGAGQAGRMILRDIMGTMAVKDRVVCFIDDNPDKWGRFIDGVPIVGGRYDILASVEKYQITKIYVVIPSAGANDKKEIINICNEAKCELKQLPGMYQLMLGQISVSAMKDVSVEDLLGREPIRADLNEVFSFINGKSVLITGGGGSIGSELCRQVAAHNPKQLIIFDIYENNAYEIQLELRHKFPDLDLAVLIGSVRDSRKMHEVFSKYHPQIVYHAAAHKHVPLMEDSPCEAIKNNAIGTYKTAYAAMVHGCERFVLISTDKAVNPTNIMGASKRLCEMIIQSFDCMIKAGRAGELPQLYTHAESTGNGCFGNYDGALTHAKTEYVAVRFGNVLGSNGSVIPLFKHQIAEGGPVTVTHPDIIRYFMTIPEAVSLVMLAGTYAHGGEIFVLDMGSPVKIDTLARNLIKLSGFTPDEDIKIVYTGLRPGEKLYEEKLMAEEGLKKTDNDLIHIGCPVHFDVNTFLGQLENLMQQAYRNDEHIGETVEKMVSTYRPHR
jgi:FlaA1/EpsC-like NDP-sugar epimerase